MRKMKKIASLMMALVMVLAMSVTAFATEPSDEPESTSYTITISEETADYTYVAYQIFAGDLSTNATGGYVLSNIVWGSGIDSANETLQAALTSKYGTTDAAMIAESITTTEQAAAFAEIVADYLVSTEGSTSIYSEEDTNYTIDVDEVGYYLIVNTSVPNGNYGYSDYILEVVGDTTTQPKNDSTPDFDKTVGEETDDVATEYAIGDDIPFTLTATLPDSYDAYTTYKLVFTDTLSNGLTYNGDLVVKVGNVELEVDEDYTLTVSGQTITVTITDVKSLDVEGVTIAADTVITVSYSAKLNASAGSVETNDATLTFSNNPNGEGEGTTGDKTYVVTFTLTVSKTDGTNALAGAAFTLYTKDTEGNYSVVVKEFEAGTATSFSFNGLAEGDYKLVESTTPTGYNTIDDIYFTVSAVASEDASQESGVSVTSSVNVTGGTATITASSTSLSTEVVNNAGSSLPSTGGIGTTIFYVVGTVLVLGAAVVLITRRRMSSEA